MARVKWFSYLLNDEGQPIKGASISIYKAGTTNAVTIYTSESGSDTISSAPQLVTNDDGYFEFWIGDSSDPNGYGSEQKFKITFDKEGVVEGYNDYISIFPNFIEVDITSSDTTKDKTVSNLLARRWEEHRLDDTHTVHGILEVNVLNADTTKNKLVSNFLAKGWEDHKDLTYNQTPHGIEQADETSSDTTKNKIISNNQLKELHDLISGSTYTITVTGSLSPSGDYYYDDISHNLNDDWPIINIYDYNEQEKIIPKNVSPVDSNTIRVWFNSEIDFVAKINI